MYASNPAISPISYFNWLPEKIKELISYVGFVTYHVTEQEIKDIRKKYLNSEEKKWIVCSDGGGKISGRFISKCLELPFVDQLSTYQFDIILGNYSTLNWPYGNEVFHTYNNVRIHKWVKDLYKLHASADCVVCSGGYNTLLESIEGKKKIIFSYSVMDSKEEDEQEKNIHNFSKYYPISEIKSLDELIEKVVDGLKKSDKCPLKTNIKFEGIKNISLIINKRRLIF